MKDTCVYVVDDEKEIADLVTLYLKNEGIEARTFGTGTAFLTALEARQPDAAVLDIMLPDTDGFVLCAKVRQRYEFPILMLTAKVEDMDKITGLAIGADDYVTKPFNPLELMARIKAQLRRWRRLGTRVPGGEEDSGREHDFQGLVINADSHKCTLYDQPLALTPIEFSILWYLCENRGRVVSSEELFEAVWGEKYLDSNNTVMAHIARLREKMGEQPRSPKFVKTVWGVGYQIEKA